MSTVLGLRAFRRLALAYTVNALGNWMGSVALAVIAANAGHGVLAVTVLMLATQLLPGVVGSSLAARLERFPAQRSLTALYALEAAVFVALALCASSLPLAAIIALAAIDGAAGMVARAILRSTAVAVTRPAGLLREGNSVITVAFSACVALGPALAGACIAGIGVKITLGANALSFALAAAAVRRVSAPRPCADAGEQPHRLRACLVCVRANRVLRTLIAADAGVSIALAMILPVELVYVTRTLHGGPGAFGVVLAAWGAGCVLGSALLPRLRDRPIATPLIASVVAMALSYLGMAAASTVTIVAICSLLGGIGNGIESYASITLIQERTPDALQPRVSALIEAIHTAMPGIGFLIGGAIAATLTPRITYISAGCTALAIVALAATTLHRPATPTPTHAIPTTA